MAKHRLIPAFVCAVLLLAAGCQRKTTGNPTPDGVKNFQIVYIPKCSGNPYFDAATEGFNKAAKELGFEASSVAPEKADATSQNQYIRQQVQRGVAAIVITPNSPDAVVPALEEAMKKGIKVITVDADLTGHETGRDAAVFQLDFDKLGADQIELMGSLIGYKGEFAILSSTTDAPNQNYWIKGMKEALKNPKYKDMKLVDTVFGNDEREKSALEARGLLTKWPNLRGMLCPTVPGLASAAQEVETQNAAAHVAVTGLGMPKDMRQFIKDGSVKKFALWSPVDMGYLAGCVAYSLVKGEVKPAPGVKFKAGSLGEREFTKLNKVILGPPLVFDKDNIDKYKF